MTPIRPIRNDDDLLQALGRLEHLIGFSSGTQEFDELEIISQLVENYETKRFAQRIPTPIEAIRFRMEQQNLQSRDLIPLLGSRARVSQILNGQRALSIDMIRALHSHLGIPAEVLIGATDAPAPDKETSELAKPAAKVLRDLGIMGAHESLQEFLERAAGDKLAVAMYRKTRTQRTNAKTDAASLQAWCAAVLLQSQKLKATADFAPEAFGTTALRELAHLSRLNDGPRRARDWLGRRGVILVTLTHLPGTFLDGASMMRADGVPVIALTLRRDRIDNFWFTLLHECVHVARHLGQCDLILDDLEIDGSDSYEREADLEAGRALIPDGAWRSFNSGTYCSTSDVIALSTNLGIHPAIVAGRWQMENRDFRRFSKMLGHGDVRSWFGLPSQTSSG